MTDTNRLLRQTVDETSGSDLIRLWSTKFGGDVSLSLSNLKTWLGLPAEAGGKTVLTTQYASPNISGFNILVSEPSTWLIITPDAAYAAGTITLPTSAGVPDKSEILIVSTQQITALTVDGNGASAVSGAPSSMSASDAFRLRYDAQSFTWYRVSSS